MFVSTPSIRNSLSARAARVTASSKRGVGEWLITFASSESNAALVW